MSDAADGRPGTLYLRLCRSMTKGAGGERGAEARKRRAMEIRRLEAEVEDLDRRMPALQTDNGERARLSKELGVERERLDRLKRVQEQRDFRKAMRITGMGLEPEQVVRFSSSCALLAFVGSLVVTVLIWVLLPLSFMTLILVSAVLLTVLPLAVFVLVLGYPERLARNMELEAFGSAPDVINYMVMSMELSPSLDSALRFAAENAEGPMARELEALIWKVQSRERASTEETLVEYARELRDHNEELRSALYHILSASKEREGGADASLSKASDIVLTGTRQRVEGFAASLSTPSTVLFALGILLPMVIGSLLPMLSIGVMDLGLGPAGSQTDGGGWLGTFVACVLLMNIAFPLMALLYSRGILARRPRMYTVTELGERGSNAVQAGAVLVGFGLLALLVLTQVSFWGLEGAMASILVVLGVAVSIGVHLRGRGALGPNIKALETLEEEMPDMLYQLGSRLLEGLSLERGMEEVAVSMKGTEIGGFLNRAVMRMRVSGQSMEELLLDRSGLLAAYPSRKLSATLRLIVRSSRKDPETAGRMIITMSNHMRDLANTDREMRLGLRPTVDSMRNTALLFAPVIMGVTVGLFSLLGGTFSEMQGDEMMPTSLFILVIGLFLLEMVAIIVHFTVGIEHGSSSVELRKQLAFGLPLSTGVFCLVSLLTLLAFG